MVTFADDLPAPALSELGAAVAAAWLVDVGRGLILAANRAGGHVLGLEGCGAPLALDGAMPALARLRGLAAERNPGDAPPERLLFWGRDGAARPLCRIRLQGQKPNVLAIVVAADTGDDTAKLGEIARGRAGAQSAPHPAFPAPVPPSVRASLAHELKTPASAIAAAAEIMKDERFGPLGATRYIGYAADIHGTAQHMLVLIDRMLAEDGGETDGMRADLDFAEIDVEAALSATVSQLAPLAEQAGITLSLKVQPGLPHVVADATSLRQMVLNLATNAFKFTHRGGTVTVSARYGGEGPLTIAIEDTGTGMTEGDVERLLMPGGPSSTERPRNGGSGLGLGLPLVRALAAANGAQLAIESVPARGTSASIVFAKDRVIPV